jgi:hypothetical protein
MVAQNRLYSVLTVDPGSVVPRTIGVHVDLLHAAADPLAVVSCDNLPSNGKRTRALVEAALAAVPGPAGERARRWLDGSLSFPGTMVDRILPATTADTRAELAGDDEVRGLVGHWLTVLARDGVPAALAEVSAS